MEPISARGYPVQPEELDESDGVEAILPNDTKVTLIGWTRIRVGAPGTGEDSFARSSWEWINERKALDGLYQLLLDIPNAVKKEKKRRETLKKPYKQFMNKMKILGYQCMDDDELATDILECGLSEWLQSQ